MAEKNILHMVTPTKHLSPFDVNMALDAGYDAVLTYSNVTIEEVTGLVQDAIFSRPPKAGARTGMFFGGKNASVALDMLAKAKQALVPPFGISFFADPAGAFTTAAAMVACAEKLLKDQRKRALKGLKVAVFGATGVVGYAAGVIAALEGSDVTLVGYDGIKARQRQRQGDQEPVQCRGARGRRQRRQSQVGHSGRGRGGAVRRPRRRYDPVKGAACRRKTLADRRRRQCGSAEWRRGLGNAGERSGAYAAWHVGIGSVDHRQHQVQDRSRACSKK